MQRASVPDMDEATRYTAHLPCVGYGLHRGTQSALLCVKRRKEDTAWQACRKLSASVFIFYLHDDILGKVAEMLSEQIDTAHMLAVRIHPENERKEVIIQEPQAVDGLFGYLLIIHEASVVGDEDFLIFAELGKGIAPPGRIVDPLSSAIISLDAEGGDLLMV